MKITLAAVACAAATVALSAQAAPQEPVLARSRIIITGGGIAISPAHQVVPRNIATIVETVLAVPGEDTNGGSGNGEHADLAAAFPADATLVAELVGPSLGAPVTLTTRAGEPFRIQPLAIAGLHFLRGIRLVSGGSTLLTAMPDAVTLEVIDRVLVSQVTSRPLTADEIRDRGIVIDQTNYQVINFSAAFGFQDNKVNISFPMVVPVRPSADLAPAAPPLQLPSLQPSVTPAPSVDLPRLVEAFQTANVSVGGLLLKVEDEEIERAFNIPPLSGVIVIPGNIAYLNQFFSILTLVSNAAPGHSNLSAHDVTAEIVLPTGADTVPGSGDDPLRMARLGSPPAEQPRALPVTLPGLDGKLGTADDIRIILPQQSGNSEHLVEGLREGTHTIEIKVSAMLHGLPIGPVPISGRVLGTVEVRNPTFALTLSHPATISAGEEYELLVTLTNTSRSPANLASVNLLPRSISGATLVSEQSVQIETIAPGDSETVAFRLLSQTTGTVTATSFTSEGIPGRFELTTAVGAHGIPMSPNSLVLPPAASGLPEALRMAGLRFLGQAFALATAPVTPEGLLPLGQQIVYDRGTGLAQAGQRVSLQEPLGAVARDLLLEWTGSDFARLIEQYPAGQEALRSRAEQNFRGFDALFRQSRRGQEFVTAAASVLASDLEASGLDAFHAAWAQATVSRAPHVSAIVAPSAGSAAPLGLEILDPTGRRVGQRTPGIAAENAVPFAAHALLSSSATNAGAQLALLATPQAGSHELAITSGAAGAFDLSLIVPDGASLRRLTFLAVPMSAGSRASLRFVIGGASTLEFAVDDNGDGVADRTISPATSTAIADQGPQLVAAVQFLTGREDISQSGQLLALLFDEEISRSSSQDGLASAQLTNYSVEANQVLGAALQPGGRVVLLSLRDGIGPFVPRTVTVQGVQDRFGNTLSPSPATASIVSTITEAGGVIGGRVLKGDGTPVPSAQIRLAQSDGFGPFGTVTVKDADPDGRYSFDFVRARATRLEAVDPESGERGEVYASIRHNGQQLEVDIILLGAGTLAGRALSPAGAPLRDAVVRVRSLTRFGDVRSAVTDATGAFSITSVPVGNITIEAAHAGTNAQVVRASAIPAAGAVVVEDLTLIPLVEAAIQTGTLAGQVFRADGSTPAAGVPVFTTRGGVATTDATGAFRIERLPVGELSVRAVDQARFEQATVTTTIVAGTTITANLRLVGGTASIHGVVLNADGQPVAGAQVGGGPSLQVTSATGEFQLNDIPLGSRTISALDPATQSTGSASVTLNVAGETAAIQIVLEARGTITGRVFNAAGAPVPELRVFLLGGRNEVAVTDQNGGYTFPNVPVGSYQVSAFLPDFSDGNIVNTRLTFRGEVRIANVTFRGKGRVTGVVLADNGVTPLGARVGLSEMRVRVGTLRHPDNFHCLSNVQVGGQTIELPQCQVVGLGFRLEPLTRIIDNDVASGTFTFEDVFVGSVTVEAANALTPIVMAARGEIETPGQTINLQLRLAPTSVVTGLVLMPDGTPAGEDVVVTLDGRNVVTDATGRFTHFEVAPGSFTLTAEDPETGYVGRVGGNVAPGVTADMTIRLLGRGTLGVEVRGVGGLLSGASVRVTAGGYPNQTREGVTGADGRILFSGADELFEGSVSVRATHSGITGFASGTITRDAQLDLVVQIPDQSGTVEGTFFNASGTQPIANAQIRLSSAGGEAFATTLADGTFRFEGVRMGGVTVEAFDPVTARRGRATGTLSSHGQVLTLEIRQVAQGSVRGIVRLSTDESAVAAASVTISVNSVFGAQFRTTTNADGSFVFPGVSAGTFSLSANGLGLSGSASGSLETEGQVVAVDVILQVPARGRVEGTVTTATGAPALGAQVVMGSRNTTVDNAGFYFFDDVPMGGLTVRAIALAGPDGGVANGSLVYAGEVATVNVQFVGTGSLTGTVRSGGAPVQAATVNLTTRNASGRGFSATTQTNSAGQYAFPTVPVGEVSVSAVQAGTQLAGTASGAIAANGQALELTVDLQPSAAFRARVLREGTNEPAAAMGIEVVGVARRFGSTLSDGTLRFASLPLGTYQLIVTDPLGEGIIRATVTLDQDGEEVDLGDLVLDESPPAVLSITPADGAAQVPVTGSIVVFFSEPVAANTVTTSSIVVAIGSASVAGSLALSPDLRTATFTPAIRFTDFTSVSVKVTTAVRDLVGRALTEVVTSTFLTADSIPPVTQSVSPAAGATGVQPGVVIRVAYNEAISMAGFSGAPIEVRLGGALVAGTVAPILNNTAIVFTPSTPLQPNATYQVTVRPATDAFGNLQAQGSAFSFSTVDTLAPTIQQLTPDAPSAFEGSSITVTAQVVGTDVASVEFLVNGAVVATDSSAPFQAAIPVTATLRPSFVVSARATDTSGNISSPASLTLEVQSDTPPTVTILAPADGTSVDSGSTLTLQVRGTDDRGISRIAYQTSGQVTTSGAFVVNPAVSPSEATFGVPIPANVAPGPLLIRAATTDTTGASSQTMSVTVTVVDRTQPTVQILSPAAGTGIRAGESATITIALADNGQLASVTLEASGAVTFAETRALSGSTGQVAFNVPVPESISGDPSFTIAVRALDAAGNESAVMNRVLGVIVPDTTPPALTILGPAEGAVFRQGQTVTFNVRATDNAAVERITFTASGAVTASNTVTIDPVAPAADRSFSVQIPLDAAPGALVLTAEAFDTSGLSSGVSTRNVTVEDGVAPVVRVVSPAAGTSIDPRSPLTVVIEATDVAGVTAITLTASGALSASETRTIDPAEAVRSETFTLTFGAPPAAGGTLTLNASARDAAGNAGQAAAVALAVQDVVAPDVAAVTPANGATNVDPGSSVVVQFTEPMSAASVTSSTLAMTLNGALVDATLTLTADGRTATIAPQAPLELGAEYTLTATAGLADVNGNALVASRTFTFRTISPDTTAPRVESTNPANNAVDVPLSTPIDVTFTEPIAPGSVTAASFRVLVGGSTVQGTFGFFNGNARARFSPAVPLPPDTVVVVELTNAVTDPAGNPLADATGSPLTTPFTFTFATGRFGITSPRAGSTVVENSTITVEAQASASLGVASVIFTINGQAQPPITTAPFRTTVQVPPRGTQETLIVAASARNAQGVEIANDTRSVPVVLGLVLRPTLSGVPLGGTRRLLISLSSVATEAVSVELRAGDPLVVTFPANPVVIPAGETSVEAAIHGAAAGNTTVFAESSYGDAYAIVSVGAVPVDTEVDVSAPPASASVLVPASAGMVLGDPGQSLSVSLAVLSSPTGAATSVSVVSTNPLVATATASDVAAGQQTATLSITTGVSGIATLIIRAGDDVRSITVVVGNVPGATTPLATAPLVGTRLLAGTALGHVVFGATGQAILTLPVLPSFAGETLPLTVESLDPAVATATAGPIAAGSRVSSVTVTANGTGRTTLLLRSGTQAWTLDVIVGATNDSQAPAVFAPAVGSSVIAAPGSRVHIPIGSVRTVSVRALTQAAATNLPVTVTSSDPAVVSVSAPAQLAAGEQVVALTLTTGLAGRATITIDVGGQRTSIDLRVGEEPNASTPAAPARPVGVSITVNPELGRIFAPSGNASAATLVVPLLSAAAASPVPVVVTTSNPGVAGIGASASIDATVAAGSQTLELSLSVPGVEGVSLITFEYEGQRRQLLVIVGNPPASQIPAVSAPIVGVEIR